MALQQLGSVPAALSWLVRRGARGLVTDSRRLEPGDAFIAWPGLVHDGRQHVKPALTAGAAACVIEADGAEVMGFDDLRIAAMDGLKANAGPLASAFFGAPSERLSVIAITGTNGKTSTAWWTAQALSALGRRCGMVGTLGMGAVPGPEGAAALVPTGLTTPDPVTLQRAFKRFADDGFAACAIEASSIGLVEERLSGTHIDVAVFTNFSQDHLDFHGSMDAYWQAKAGLFDWPGLRAAVLNVDDAHGLLLQERLTDTALDLWAYAATTETPARLRARDIRYLGDGLAFELVEAGAPPVSLRSGLLGSYNVSNLLAVVATLRALGVTLSDAARACALLTSVPGRMQRVASAPTQPEVLVDYAHTPDALEKALRALAPLAASRGGALWCVFGCGGNRDTSKRPLMGAMAQRHAQWTVVTSDNPRGEVPGAIISAIVAGMAERPAPQIIEDRREAIAWAIHQAQPSDVVLIAGKGHEDYQEIAGVRHPFDDVVEARAALQARAAAGVTA
jgi:UDP-N-acetylmuramyl-tripeptide synthetase